MKNDQSFEQDLASIHQLMERSVKFISLSGLSGILSGIYALVGAGAAYFMGLYPSSLLTNTRYPVQEVQTPMDLVGLGLVVLIASIGTGVWLSARRARRSGVNIWGAPGRRLLINLMIPLSTGGLFVLICLWLGYYDLLASSTLVFYGLALVNASSNLYDEVRYLGISEIVLGLISMVLPEYSLLFWAIGFGILHIIYGSLLYKKYE